MKKIISIIIVFISISTLFSCQYFVQLKSDKVLTKKIELEFSDKLKTTDLTKLDYFKWDSVIILAPYSNIESIEEKLNLDLENIRNNKIHSYDNINLMVFLEKGKSVKISELSRSVGDFENLEQIIERDKTIFSFADDGKIIGYS